MKMRVLFSLLFVMAVAGCKAPQKPVINDDTIETSQGNGVTLRKVRISGEILLG